MSSNKPIFGKYKFNTSGTSKVTSKFSNIGVPLESIVYTFKVGDVIDVQNAFWNDQTNEWELDVSSVTGQNLGLPLSIFTKVSNATPVSKNIQSETVTGSGGTNQVIGHSIPKIQTFDSTRPKQIIIILLVIGLIVLGLKYKNII